MKKVFIQNFGCRATQADGAAIEGILETRGMEFCSAVDADLIILNTCTVTSSADDDVRKSIHRAHRENPEARILVTGCYAQRAPAELSRIPGVTWVVGNSHKTRIPDILEDPAATPYHGQIHVGDMHGMGTGSPVPLSPESTGFLSSPVRDAFGDRTRPNLKIQDGCSNLCSFCIIPAVRGRSRSMSVEQVIDQVRALSRTYREIVLTGINLGRWGREPGFRTHDRMRLSGLVQLILRETAVERLRLSSIEPMDLSGDLLDLMAAEPRIAAHVHAPLQSGSDTVLKRMKRRYRVRHYEDRLLRAVSLMPDAALGADVMTGFPGESDTEFRETLDFVERLPFTYLHVFTYSERPGTPAAALPQVPHKIRKDRTRALRALAARKNLDFRRRLLGRTLSAVTIENGFALTSNYVKVMLAAPRPANELVDLEIGALTSDGLAERGPFAIVG